MNAYKIIAPHGSELAATIKKVNIRLSFSNDMIATGQVGNAKVRLNTYSAKIICGKKSA
ncbi:MAG: hypothetical protein K2K47_06965 [Duncaniella sp.]|nr:hypothetical protein [Duncaniella sp.]